MLEKLPPWFGRALKSMRPGLEKIVAMRPDIVTAPASIVLTSSAFEDGQAMPARFTEDGAKISPPLAWTDLPVRTASLVLVAEDADSPTPMPLVHAIVWGISTGAPGLTEGAIAERDASPPVGQNSFFKPGWLPPDPPPGHGPHRYAFQLFALDTSPTFGSHPGRRAVVAAIAGHVLARGLLVGTYERT